MTFRIKQFFSRRKGDGRRNLIGSKNEVVKGNCGQRPGHCRQELRRAHIEAYSAQLGQIKIRSTVFLRRPGGEKWPTRRAFKEELFVRWGGGGKNLTKITTGKPEGRGIDPAEALGINKRVNQLWLEIKSVVVTTLLCRARSPV